jgi:hypothetical protein
MSSGITRPSPQDYHEGFVEDIEELTEENSRGFYTSKHLQLVLMVLSSARTSKRTTTSSSGREGQR